MGTLIFHFAPKILFGQNFFIFLPKKKKKKGGGGERKILRPQFRPPAGQETKFFLEWPDLNRQEEGRINSVLKLVQLVGLFTFIPMSSSG